MARCQIYFARRSYTSLYKRLGYLARNGSPQYTKSIGRPIEIAPTELEHQLRSNVLQPTSSLIASFNQSKHLYYHTTLLPTTNVLPRFIFPWLSSEFLLQPDERFLTWPISHASSHDVFPDPSPFHVIRLRWSRIRLWLQLWLRLWLLW